MGYVIAAAFLFVSLRASYRAWKNKETPYHIFMWFLGSIFVCTASAAIVVMIFFMLKFFLTGEM